jgi:hypothetical protein
MEPTQLPSKVITNQTTRFGSGGTSKRKPNQTASDPSPKAPARDKLGFLITEENGSLQLLGWCINSSSNHSVAPPDSPTRAVSNRIVGIRSVLCFDIASISSMTY